MSENKEMRKVFEDRQKDIYQGFEELNSYPDGKYLSHYVRCDFDWFQAAWEHQQIKIKELESQLAEAKTGQVKVSEIRNIVKLDLVGDFSIRMQFCSVRSCSAFFNQIDAAMQEGK